MMVLCSISFLLLNHLHIAKKLYVSIPTTDESDEALEPGGSGTHDGVYQSIELEDSSGSGESLPKSQAVETSDSRNSVKKSPKRPKLDNNDYLYLVVLIFFVNAISNGILPSVSSYSSLPYGQTAYHLSTSLGNMANPLACFIAFFLPTKSYPGIGAIFLIAVGKYGAVSRVWTAGALADQTHDIVVWCSIPPRFCRVSDGSRCRKPLPGTRERPSWCCSHGEFGLTEVWPERTIENFKC